MFNLNRNTFILLIGIMMICFPDYTFAKSSDNTIDMELYSAVAGYGFAAFLIVFFSYLIYHASGDHEEHVRIMETQVIQLTQKVTSATIQGLNAVYYSIIVLIFLYLITFVILMF